eukprot:3859745-Amphidinium_carterae.2
MSDDQWGPVHKKSMQLPAAQETEFRWQAGARIGRLAPCSLESQVKHSSASVVNAFAGIVANLCSVVTDMSSELSVIKVGIAEVQDCG